MGLIANLLKRKSVPEDKVDSSLQMLDMLKQKRGDQIGKYLDLWVDPRDVPPPPSTPSTIEELDERVPEDSSRYSPPMATEDCPDLTIDLTDTGDPIETGINRFFDVFVGKAILHNQTVNNQDLSIGIRRPWQSGESFPEDGGKPVLNACLHTAHWGIFFFGHDNNIDLYLLPYDEGSALTFKEVHADDCVPLLAVTTRDGNAGREWFVDGKQLFRDRIPDLARDLLSDLVHAHENQQACP